jgi:hypothetical protein
VALETLVTLYGEKECDEASCGAAPNSLQHIANAEIDWWTLGFFDFCVPDTAA